MRWSLILVLVAGCTESSGEPDVTGPFSGEVRRFVVDRFTFAASNPEARALGDDLTGDGIVDNQFGSAGTLIVGYGNLNEHEADMIGSGVLASSIEIQADDLAEDPTVSVRYFGADGDPAVPVAGKIIDGVFRSNRTRFTSIPGAARLHLPIFVDTDPSILDLAAMQIDLVPDGRGGFDGIVCGGFVDPEAKNVAAAGFVDMLKANPQDHPDAVELFDGAPRDGIVTLDETLQNTLLQHLLASDSVLFVAGEDAHVPTLSVGFGIHLSPCEAGSCAAEPANRCFDRVLDGDEAGVDCGGSCELACPGGSACEVPGDCQSGSCDGGSCRAVSCSDGIQNGFELGVDCGWNCKYCVGTACSDDAHCASRACGPMNQCVP